MQVRFYDGAEVRVFDNEECEFRYRESIFKRHKEWIIFSADLRLDPADAAALRRTARRHPEGAQRKVPGDHEVRGQHLQEPAAEGPCPHAVAAEVPASAVREGKVPAAWFLEQVGAKGMRRGDIHVATYHANLIYNAGAGTAADLCALIADLKERVRGALRHRAGRRSAIRGLKPGSPLSWSWPLGLGAADLHEAVQSGNLDRVKEQVAQGADVNQRDVLGATPLHDASWSGHLEIAQYLIEHGADVNARHAEGGSTPLAYAVIKNDYPMAEMLLGHGADVHTTDKSGGTPLHLAADRGYLPLVELLIAHGANVSVRDHGGSSPLDEAALRGYRIIAHTLILRGAHLDEANPQTGDTPLNEAASKGNREVVELLLALGANRNRRDRSGATPLENAARARHTGALEALLAKESPEASGALLHEAALKGQTEIADILVSKGANVDARDKTGATPLHQAALKGNLAIARLLLDHGAAVDARDGDGGTPLLDAVISGHTEVAALLLDRGADREARDTGEPGATPLYHAAAWGRIAVLQLLIARGADVNAKGKAGKTPLEAAVANGFPEAARILKEHGAK